MRFLIETDGPIFNVAAAYFRLHCESAAAVGWSSLDQPSFLSAFRKDGRQAMVLRGAKPLKLKEYQTRFDQQVEADAVIAQFEPNEGIATSLVRVVRHSSNVLLASGSNVAARRARLVQAGLGRFASTLEALPPDQASRAGRLKTLAAGDRSAVVVSSSDIIIRAAGLAEVIAIGIQGGMCAETRLYQAGAAVVYRDLTQLAEALETGADELARAGLPVLKRM